MQIRDRIQELRRVRAGELRPHPKNWRKHPRAQQDALRGLLAEIGYAGALLARALPDGSLQLLDGHLRAEITPEMEVPVLVVDLDDREAAKLLALHDTLTAMAATDEDALADLLRDVDTENDAVRAVLDNMTRAAVAEDDEDASGPSEAGACEAYQVVVECGDEPQQREVFERLTAEGLKCRLLTL